MSLKLVIGEKKAKDTLYIRGIEDEDGEFAVEVSQSSNFADPVGVVWFSVDGGKLNLRRFTSGLEGLGDVIDTDDGGILVIN